MEIHSNELIACNECGKQYKKGTLGAHMRLVHRAVRNYYCQFPSCEKVYKCTSHVIRHMREKSHFYPISEVEQRQKYGEVQFKRDIEYIDEEDSLDD